jgi:hypothetical protein
VFSSRSYLLKRKSRLEPATTGGFFSSRLAPFCNNPLNRVRVYGVVTVEETAEFLKLSPRTVEREWTMAKVWLYRALSEEDS